MHPLMFPLLLTVFGCADPQPVSPPPAPAPAPADPEEAVRFSFSVNGLEHGNGAL